MNKTKRLSISYSIPELIAEKITVSKPYQNFSAKGNPTSFGINIEFPVLKLMKNLKSTDFYLLGGKIESTLHDWENKYKRHLEEQNKNQMANSADELNNEIKNSIMALEGILSHTLKINDAVNWDDHKRTEPFRILPTKLFKAGKIPDYLKFDGYGKPTNYEKLDDPEIPNIENIQKKYGLFGKIFNKKKIQDEYENQMETWTQNIEDNKLENEKRKKLFDAATHLFEDRKQAFEKEKALDNEALEKIKTQYSKSDPIAIEEYCDLVLETSIYPDFFPKTYDLEYRPDNRLLVLDYELPSPNKLPTVKSYSFIKSRNEITEKHMSEAEHKKLYENVIYQICIRTLHELFEADVISGIDAVAFNGLVTQRNPATGIKETKVIMSVMASKEKFVEFNLAKVDPKATFKHLKGVSAARLIDLTPIPPIIKMDKSDKRFITGKNIVDQLDDSVNLASMDWENFEHLIREVFEKEFSSDGGEVKVTRASSDGGVDAIAFDPDPIRGGKIVIQAKRYTNTVGVAAVRDLYGTVMNEGATKGVLVTTSDYGKDSYEFAKDKPISLLNGSNLLSLLEKHGHKARINVSEAKKFFKK